MLDVKKINIDYVSLDYLKGLTGCGQKEPMIGWLAKNRYKFDIGKEGWPRVTKSYIDYRLGPDIFDAEAESVKRKSGNERALRAAMGIC